MIIVSDVKDLDASGIKKRIIETKNIQMVIDSDRKARRNKMKYKKKKSGEAKPPVSTIIRRMIDIIPKISVGLLVNNSEAGFDLFFILI